MQEPLEGMSMWVCLWKKAVKHDHMDVEHQVEIFERADLQSQWILFARGLEMKVVPYLFLFSLYPAVFPSMIETMPLSIFQPLANLVLLTQRFQIRHLFIFSIAGLQFTSQALYTHS
jgi:hypothetical protein